MTSPGSEPDRSVLGRLQPPAFDADAAAAYEVTRELIGRVLGLYSARRADLEKATPRDDHAIAEMTALQHQYAQLMQTLDPADTEHVAKVRAACARILKDVDPSGR